jgi:hypothetical protein
VGHVSVVLTRLIGAPVNYVVKALPIHIRVSLHQSLDGHSAQIISPHAAEGAGVPAERCALGITNKSVNHGKISDKNVLSTKQISQYIDSVIIPHGRGIQLKVRAKFPLCLPPVKTM